MKEKKVRFTGLLLLCCSVALIYGSPAAGDMPPRLEVIVDSTLQLSAAETAAAAPDKAFAVLYWQEADNPNHQSEHTVYLLSVAGTELLRTNLGKGVRITTENAYIFEKSFLGYYRFPVDLAAPDAQLDLYVNTIYQVGSGTLYSEARLYPPFTNVHAGYQSRSASCDNCHREYDETFTRKTILEMCLECHDGSKSSYDVLRGRVRVATGWAPSPAGPFGTVDNPSSSYHNVFLESGGDGVKAFLQYAPGSGGDRMNLTCIACHSAHAGQGSSPYRMLRFAENTPVQAYTYEKDGEYSVLYINGMNQFCGQCHREYVYGPSPNPAGYPDHLLHQGIEKAGSHYRHPTGIEITNWHGRGKNTLPLEHRDKRAYMTCKTCHRAHGTALPDADQVSPEMTDLSSSLPAADRYKYDYEGRPVVREYNGTKATYSSMLKRREGMGICLECHLEQIWANTPGARW